jgi:hypothetical protein
VLLRFFSVTTVFGLNSLDAIHCLTNTILTIFVVATFKTACHRRRFDFRGDASRMREKCLLSATVNIDDDMTDVYSLENVRH